MLYNNSMVINPFNNVGLDQKQLYRKLKKYYSNNGLYDNVEMSAYYSNVWVEAIKPLLTCVNRSVEFYAGKLLAGYQVSAANNNLKTAIEQILSWSNFKAQSKIAIRNDALLGNLFWKVNSDGKKVWFEIIDPDYVTSFKTDNRGYITEIRLDIPTTNDDGKTILHTEFYDKEYYSIWESETNNESTKLDQLNGLIDYGFLAEIGTGNFVPFVHVKFRDTGDQFGVSCVFHALDKIDEANRERTRLDQMLFKNNKSHWIVSANSTDKDNRPLPAPKLKQGSISSDSNWNDESVIYLPGMSQMQSLVPNIQYDAALNIINALLKELTEDLPELKYYSLAESQLSSKAIRLMLAGALDRANEARENIVDGLIRVIQMALTVANFWGIFSVGTFENGDFEFSVVCSEMFPSSEDEKATTLKLYTDAGMPLDSALKRVGFTDDEIAQVIQAKQISDTQKTNLQTQSLANAMMNFNGA